MEQDTIKSQRVRCQSKPCGRRFTVRKDGQIYCSPRCRWAANNAERRRLAELGRKVEEGK